MVSTDESPSEKNPASINQAKQTRKNLRHASTADVRALLSDLRKRPLSQREFLRRLLKRAADQAATTDSAVQPAETHHTSTS
jgi:hypothetical protein